MSACGSTAPPTLDGSSQIGNQAAQALARQVNDASALGRLQALQTIADSNGGTRAAATPGYDSSVDYATGVLKAAGLDVTTPTYRIEGGTNHDASGNRDSGGDRRGPLTQRNVIAQTRTGDQNHVVMIGAHLDSVPEGPGIVDDGSGVATVLEIATRVGASPPVHNAIRFALFGSEETGAQGSKSYVQSLSSDDEKEIMLYLNVDMVASSNAGYFVQGGTGDGRSETGAPGSDTVGQVLADQLKATGVTPEKIPFVGDDEGAFIKAGIPTGGAENGDANRKTIAQAQTWGGQAGATYDPCYHTRCDRLSNVNRDVLSHYLRAVAGSVGYFAATATPPPGCARGDPSPSWHSTTAMVNSLTGQDPTESQ